VPFFLEVDDQYNFSLQIMHDSETVQLSPALLFKKAISSAISIKKIFENILEKEGKISGQKRSLLVESIDTLFTYLVLLKHKLLPNDTRKDALQSSDGVRVPFRRKFNKFLASGKIEREDLQKIKNFQQAFDTRILAKLKDLLQKYNEAARNTTGAANNDDLFSAFDEIFYQSILIRYSVENLMLDR
jgi:phosphoribosyl-ATP pyrophosphohydrolase